MADIIEESETGITFRWYAIPEGELPPLTVKIRKKDGKYKLSYLNEYGEERTEIQGKMRKGKNKKGGKITVKKEFKRDNNKDEKGEEER